ncbi:pesticidal protein [Bacillus thuringiensis]|uniref:pesticidal protein n=1 Tax=Bacillus thuringiensis TaxID=1428 RepID=UPI00208E6461|nr:pesticidal protein [Bacillus thuringiensis]
MLGAVLKQSNDYLGATSLFLLPAGYITKELEYFSETEGTIFVESAELLYIEI